MGPPQVIRENYTKEFSLLDNVKLLAITDSEDWWKLKRLSKVYTHYLGLLLVDCHEVLVSEHLKIIQIKLKLVGVLLKT